MKQTRTLELELTDDQVLALAQFTKRVTFTAINDQAVDENETYLMRDALDELRRSLDAIGYSPR